MVEQNDVEEKKAVRDGAKFFEDDMLKVEFVFTDGYLTTINIGVKDEDYMGRVDLSNKKMISSWLANANRAVVTILANAPNTEGGPMVRGMEIIDSGDRNIMPTQSPMAITPDEIADRQFPLCPRCKIELRYKERCCGGTGSIVYCPQCGLKAKVGKQ